MSALLLLVVCFVVGLGLQRVSALPAAMPQALNAFILWVSLPALVLLHVPRLQPTWALVLPIVTPWVVVFVALAFFGLLCRMLGWSRATWGALVLTGGLGNTSFVGLPMVEALFGREHLGLALLIDQFGSFVMLSTLGMMTAAVAAGERLAPRAMAARVLRFPPFIALLAAFALSTAGPLPDLMIEVLERIGATLAPLALVSVGMQLRLGALRGEAGPLAAGLGYKLLLAPALVWALCAGVANLDTEVLGVTVVEAAMAPMITGSIVATEYRLRPALAALMVGVGIPLSFLTAPLWAHLVTGL